MSHSTLIFSPNVTERRVTSAPKGKFTYKLLNGNKFEASKYVIDDKRKFEWVSVLIRDLLIPAEIVDLDKSWAEIREGRAKKFSSINEFLRELKGSK